ncbi:MAG: MraY family glycosyltransferase [bacterium]|nr:MraY family glycosyltransferase [bacterium]
MSDVFFWIFIFLGTFILSALFTFICIKVAKKFRIVDMPNERKIHKEPVPYLGGVAIYFSFMIIMFISLKISPTFNLYTQGVMGVVIASLIVFLLGIYDDVKGCNASLKFTGQIISALVLIRFGFFIDRITNPLGGIIYFPYWLSLIVTVFWIVGLINAINLLDGLDGLAGGVIAVASFFLFIIALISNNINVTVLSLLLCGSSLGFLVFNFPPARIFMGDTGSMFLGLVFSLMAIMGNRKSAAAINLLVPIVLLTIPIIDTLLAILRRANRGKHIFQADKEHIHHRLLNLGIPYRKVIILIYLFCFYLGLVSLLSLYIMKEVFFIILLIIGTNVLIGLYILNIVEDRIEKNIKENGS